MKKTDFVRLFGLYLPVLRQPPSPDISPLFETKARRLVFHKYLRLIEGLDVLRQYIEPSRLSKCLWGAKIRDCDIIDPAIARLSTGMPNH